MILYITYLLFIVVPTWKDAYGTIFDDCGISPEEFEQLEVYILNFYSYSYIVKLNRLT